ncbi:hypothetical protein [Natrinema salaciae]|uniref:Uncharacterized protein n=1 Tax=Natrinema salaciae TaxID=1186196 RepID=A0A1H9CI17_9EURY|nr:hypothetical protein [Natrinema salaciae]SEQ00268.1 hypothetical protein SAMN04489841_1046 [Natrinema salaciae]
MANDPEYGRENSSNSSTSNRRSVLKAIGGTTVGIGALGTMTDPAVAHHNEEPDHDYGVKSDNCDTLGNPDDIVINQTLKAETWYRGFDSDRHKHEWVTAIGCSAITEDENGSVPRDIQKGVLEVKWNEDRYDYPAVEPRPAGYSPKAYAYKDATDPLENPCETCDHVMQASAGLLAGYVGGTVGSVLWTGGTLAANYLDENVSDNSGPNLFLEFDFENWANHAVEQAHYNWVYHVYLDLGDRQSVTVTTTDYGHNATVSSAIELTYDVHQFQYEIHTEVEHDTIHSDSC